MPKMESGPRVTPLNGSPSQATTDLKGSELSGDRAQLQQNIARRVDPHEKGGQALMRLSQQSQAEGVGAPLDNLRKGNPEIGEIVKRIMPLPPGRDPVQGQGLLDTMQDPAVLRAYLINPSATADHLAKRFPAFADAIQENRPFIVQGKILSPNENSGLYKKIHQEVSEFKISASESPMRKWMDGLLTSPSGAETKAYELLRTHIESDGKYSRKGQQIVNEIVREQKSNRTYQDTRKVAAIAQQGPLTAATPPRHTPETQVPQQVVQPPIQPEAIQFPPTPLQQVPAPITAQQPVTAPAIPATLFGPKFEVATQQVATPQAPPAQPLITPAMPAPQETIKKSQVAAPVAEKPPIAASPVATAQAKEVEILKEQVTKLENALAKTNEALTKQTEETKALLAELKASKRREVLSDLRDEVNEKFRSELQKVAPRDEIRRAIDALSTPGVDDLPSAEKVVSKITETREQAKREVEKKIQDQVGNLAPFPTITQAQDWATKSMELRGALSSDGQKQFDTYVQKTFSFKPEATAIDAREFFNKKVADTVGERVAKAKVTEVAPASGLLPAQKYERPDPLGIAEELRQLKNASPEVLALVATHPDVKAARDKLHKFHQASFDARLEGNTAQADAHLIRGLIVTGGLTTQQERIRLRQTLDTDPTQQSATAAFYKERYKSEIGPDLRAANKKELAAKEEIKKQQAELAKKLKDLESSTADLE